MGGNCARRCVSGPTAAQRINRAKKEQQNARDAIRREMKKLVASDIPLATSWNIKTLWMPVWTRRIRFMDILQGRTDCSNHKGRKSTIFALNCFFHFFHYVAWKTDGFVNRRRRGWYLKSAHRLSLAIHFYQIRAAGGTPHLFAIHYYLFTYKNPEREVEVSEK